MDALRPWLTLNEQQLAEQMRRAAIHGTPAEQAEAQAWLLQAELLVAKRRTMRNWQAYHGRPIGQPRS